MLKKASGRAAAAPGRGDPPAHSRPTAKVTEGGAGAGRPASRLLSTRSLPSLFTESPMKSPASAPELLSRAPLRSGGRSGGGGAGSGRPGAIGGSPAAAGLAGVLVAEEADRGSCRNSRRVLRGTRLRVQLPPPPPPQPGGGGDLPGSPIEFGVKNRDAQLALLSPVQRSPLSLSAAARLARRRSEVEELAEEDYTCVIARGPNPKMTHIFEDRVVESRAAAACCCFLSSSCSGCNKDGALSLLKSGREREFCTDQRKNEGALVGERAGGSRDSAVAN